MVDPEDSRARRRTLRLLAIGAASGLALAAVSLVHRGVDRAAVPDGAIAVVNGAPIRVDDYERLLQGLASDSRGPIDDVARRHVLNRMIDEELLVQHALELGLARVDRRVRANLTAALIASVVADADTRESSPEQLRDFFAQNRAFFTAPGRLRLQQIFFHVGSDVEEDPSRQRAEQARRRLLAGERLQDVRRSLGDSEVSRLPDTYLSPAKLRDYIGPTALRAALALEIGGTSEVVRSGTGLHLLRLVDREPPRSPDFEHSIEQVRSEWRRRAGDDALRAYLDELRADAEIAMRELGDDSR